MFKFLVKFGKIMVIACLIGVAFRVIEVTTKKDYNIAQINQNETIAEDVNIDNTETEMKDISVSNNIEEKQVEDVESKSEEKENIQISKSDNDKVIKNEIKDSKVEKKTETIKTENKQEQQKEQESTKQEVVENNKETTKKEETKIEESYTEETINVAEKKECIGNNHGMGVGNSGKWYNTKEEAIAYYTSLIDYWDEWWQNADPNNTEADETYYKNCPDGYEIWSCPYCNKWTINLYY